MDHTATAAKKSMWFRHVGKAVTLAASSGAALVSIFTALYSYGIIGHSESHQSIGNLGAAWVGLRPAIDTAYAIDDTVHYAATVTDNNGSVLVGARPTWTTGDSTVATVLTDGSVIAHGPGRTTITVVVGKLVTHSTIIVRQRVASVEVGRASGDSVVVLPEGAELQLKARAIDARGHPITGLEASWHIDDNTVAALDSAGVLTGRNAGKTLLTAKVDGVSGQTAVSVVTPASAIALVAGSSQRALAGKALAQAVVVRATNRKGGPAAAKRVTFRVVDGQGSVEPATAVTDADGRARANWTLGADPGRQTLFASVENVDSALAIVAEADPVAENTRVAALADHLSGHAGDLLTDTVAVRVTDSTGRVLSDVPVRWVAVDGSVTASDARTDSVGIARAQWTLGKKTGQQRVRAQVGNGPGLGIAPVTIIATALAGPAANMTVTSGDNQRAQAGAELPRPVVVKVVDENGSAVSGASVRLAASGGTLSDTTVLTDSIGYATARWTMGRSAGDYTLAVHVDGVKKLLKLAAHATPAGAANLAFDDVPGEAASRESGKRKRLLALVTDLYGNPVADARVYFSVKSGTVSPARAVSDAKGHAVVTWKLGSKPGEQTLTGTVRGTDVTGEYVTVVGGRETLAKTVSLKSAVR
ncbi:MAG TPA: Ig-like domain-containing protein [Gemmatimonadaceae bacterium]|jgi:adhesin/invasin|nr:Ig-like domain-containing protein [Gemmatimonadaceae bacterium]